MKLLFYPDTKRQKRKIASALSDGAGLRLTGRYLSIPAIAPLASLFMRWLRAGQPLLPGQRALLDAR